MEIYADTAPEIVSPFAITEEEDPREIQRQALAVLERAYQRRAAIPHPSAYWEEPGYHGSGREISLRRRPRVLDDDDVTGQWVRPPMRLPPMPDRHTGAGPALVVGGLVGIGVLVWYLWNSHKNSSTQVGGDFDGLEILGAE